MDDEDLAYMPGPPAPSLYPAQGFATLTPSAVVSPHKDVYVLEIADLGQTYAVSFSEPFNNIGLLDKATLREAASLHGHSAGITALDVMKDGRSVLSSSSDGTVIQWDPRSRKSLNVLHTGLPKNAPLLSLSSSCNSTLIATGTELQGADAFIHFWDVRNPSKLLQSHSSTHSDDITSLSFHPSDPTSLLSASTDGLVSLTNAQEQDEDEAVVEVGNWGTSVARAGWSATGQRVWARSDMETVSLWDAELSLIHDFGDARRPAVHGKWTTDYIVQCGFKGDDLLILAGSNEGSFAQISAADPASWSLDHAFTSGHSAIVRCVYFDEKHGRVVSGGEDSQLAVWTLESAAASHDVAMEVEAPRIRTRPAEDEEMKSPGGEQRGRKKARYEPYTKHRP